MRNKIIVVVCVLVAFGLGIVSVKAYENQRVQDNIKATKLAAETEYQKQLRSLAVENEKNKVKQECDKSKANYSALPAKEKVTKPAPDCDLELLQ